MKQLIILFILCVNVTAHGQPAAIAIENADKTDTTLKYADTLSVENTAGVYVKSDGFYGYSILLDASGNYKIISFSCMIRSVVDSGQWSIQKGTVVTLISDKKTFYKVVNINNFYFIISEAENQKFKKDLLAAKEKLKRAKPVIVDDKLMTVETMIAYTLITQYPVKELYLP